MAKLLFTALALIAAAAADPLYYNYVPNQELLPLRAIPFPGGFASPFLPEAAAYSRLTAPLQPLTVPAAEIPAPLIPYPYSAYSRAYNNIQELSSPLVVNPAVLSAAYTGFPLTYASEFYKR